MAIQPNTETTTTDTDTDDDSNDPTTGIVWPDLFVTALEAAWSDRDMVTGTVPSAALDSVGQTFRKLRGNAAKSLPAEFQMARMTELFGMTDEADRLAGQTALMSIMGALVAGAEKATPERTIINPAVAYAEAICALDMAMDRLRNDADPAVWSDAINLVSSGQQATNGRIDRVVKAAYVKHGRERSTVSLTDLLAADDVILDVDDVVVWNIGDDTHSATIMSDGKLMLADGTAHTLSAACKHLRPLTSTGEKANYNGWAMWHADGTALADIRSAYETNNSAD